METLDTIQGRFVHEIFFSEKTGFGVFRFRLSEISEKMITVTGYCPDLDFEQGYTLKGNYVEHPKYGMQFQIVHYTTILPTDKDSIVRFLSSSQFKGIGQKTALLIVQQMKDDILEKLKQNPDLIEEVDGLTDKQIKAVKDGFSKLNTDLEKTMFFFSSKGLSPRLIMKLDVIYGADAIDKVVENPYRLVEEVDGIGFKTADKLAVALGIEADDERRLMALLTENCMQGCMSGGDTYVSEEKLKQRFLYQLQSIEADFDSLLEKAIQLKKLIREENRIYPISQYESEQGIAHFLATFPFITLDPLDDAILSEEIALLEQELSIDYDSAQIEAIHSFFKEDFMILTGGPGTGKTTVVHAFVSLFKKLYPNLTVVCCAPTGRASKRLAQLTGADACTIHSLLKWDLESNTFGKTEQDPLVADLLILDEASMVDNWLFYHLLLASGNIKKICLIGDEDQLPSVGPGCLLKDLIECGHFKVHRLTKIFRQSNGNQIIQLAKDIREVHIDYSQFVQDASFIECDPYQVKDLVVKVVENALEKGYDLDDLQVLATQYSGIAGIDRLNNALQQAFNPSEEEKKEVKVGYKTFRVGDKILQLKNQPDDDVYNGDIGTLIDIDYANESVNKQTELTIDFDGIIVTYGPEEFYRLTHAYCISVHKSQGSEYQIVILPLVEDYGLMLQRRLVYTAVTRAKRSLIVCGQRSAYERAIKSLDRHQRNSTLKERLNIFIDMGELFGELYVEEEEV